jgi:hypothetical protein
LDCGGTTPLFPDTTCRVIPKRGHVRALQNEFTTADVYAFEGELEQLQLHSQITFETLRGA